MSLDTCKQVDHMKLRVGEVQQTQKNLTDLLKVVQGAAGPAGTPEAGIFARRKKMRRYQGASGLLPFRLHNETTSADHDPASPPYSPECPASPELCPSTPPKVTARGSPLQSLMSMVLGRRGRGNHVLSHSAADPKDPSSAWMESPTSTTPSTADGSTIQNETSGYMTPRVPRVLLQAKRQRAPPRVAGTFKSARKLTFDHFEPGRPARLKRPILGMIHLLAGRDKERATKKPKVEAEGGAPRYLQEIEL